MKSLIIWVVLIAGAAYGGSKAYLHNQVADAMDMAVLMMSPYADVEYSGVRSTMSGELTIEDLRIQLHDYRDDLVIDRLGIDTPSFLYLTNMGDYLKLRGDGIPDSFGIVLEGLHLPVDADYYDDFYQFSAKSRGVSQTGPDDDKGAMCTGKFGFSPDTLRSLGYDEQVFSVNMTFRNDSGHYIMEVDSSIDDMWEVFAKLEMAGDLVADMMKGAAYRPTLSNFVIDYTDRSLNERVVKHCKQLGLTDDEILAAQLDAFKYYGESNGIIFDEYLLDPYMDFLGGKNTLTITAEPNDPIAMSQIDLYKASDVPALLNLEAKAY